MGIECTSSFGKHLLIRSISFRAFGSHVSRLPGVYLVNLRALRRLSSTVILKYVNFSMISPLSNPVVTKFIQALNPKKVHFYSMDNMKAHIHSTTFDQQAFIVLAVSKNFRHQIGEVT